MNGNYEAVKNDAAGNEFARSWIQERQKVLTTTLQEKLKVLTRELVPNPIRKALIAGESRDGEGEALYH